MSSAAAVAAAATRRMLEKRERAHHEATMTAEERAERLVYHHQRLLMVKQQRLRRNTIIAQERETGGCPRHRIEMNINMVENSRFQAFIIGVIILAGTLVGISTYQIHNASAKMVLLILENIVLLTFVIELMIKFIAMGKTPWKFFYEAWNVFDFAIVAVGLLPLGGGSALMVLRLLRLLRVLKLVRALPKLRVLVVGLMMSMSAIFYIGLLLLLLFYLYAVLGVSVFGNNDPVHMGTLHVAFISLFRAATLEDWTDLSELGCFVRTCMIHTKKAHRITYLISCSFLLCILLLSSSFLLFSLLWYMYF